MIWIRRFVRLLIVILVIAGLVAAARRLVMKRRAELANVPAYGSRPLPVRMALSTGGDMSVLLRYVAVVEPIRVANVCARLTATVESIGFDEGSTVEKGTPLVRLDSRDIGENIAAVGGKIAQAEADLAANEARVASLKRSVAYWEREAERDLKLAKRGSIPEAEAEGTAEKANEFRGNLDAARKRSTAIQHLIASLKSEKAAVRTRFSYCTLTSPYTGMISRRLADPGDLAVPGKVLMVVEDRSKLKLAFDVPQEDLDRVQPGRVVQFRVGGELRTGTITLMYPSLDSARMTRAEVSLAPDAATGLPTGAYVPVGVVLRVLKKVTIVPASSVIDGPDGKPYVFLVQKDRLKAQIVQILAESGDSTAIDGVSAGERVVISTFLGWVRLAGGMRVEAIQ